MNKPPYTGLFNLKKKPRSSTKNSRVYKKRSSHKIIAMNENNQLLEKEKICDHEEEVTITSTSPSEWLEDVHKKLVSLKIRDLNRIEMSEKTIKKMKSCSYEEVVHYFKSQKFQSSKRNEELKAYWFKEIVPNFPPKNVLMRNKEEESCIDHFKCTDDDETINIWTILWHDFHYCCRIPPMLSANVFIWKMMEKMYAADPIRYTWNALIMLHHVERGFCENTDKVELWVLPLFSYLMYPWIHHNYQKPMEYFIPEYDVHLHYGYRVDPCTAMDCYVYFCYCFNGKTDEHVRGSFGQGTLFREYDF